MDIPYVRKLTTPEEQKQFAAVMANAFVYPFDAASFEPKTKEQLQREPETAWGYGDPVSSGMVIHSYDVWFDGAVVKATGVGGVASLPESRGSGGIRKIFEALLPEWYRDGITFSILYPFSHEFYRQFGYELVQKEYCYRIPVGSFKVFPHNAAARKVTSHEELENIAEIFGRRNNLYIRRKDTQWHRVSKDPLKDQRFTYAIGDEAFFSYVTEKPASGRYTLKIKDLAFRDEKALRNLLGFLYTFRSQYETIELSLPASVPLMHMIPECYDVELNVGQHGMGRIVNVSRALRQMRYPSGTGRFTVYVTDPQIAENSGVYRISYSEGKATSVLKIGKDPSDIRPEDASTIQVFKPSEEELSKPSKPSFFSDDRPTGFMTDKDWAPDAEPLADYMTYTTSAAAGFLKDSDTQKAKEEAEEAARAQAAAEEEEKTHVSDDFVTPIDLTCSIEVLTQLVVGAITIEEALYLDGVSCIHPSSLKNVFPRKDIFFTDGF